MRLRSAPYRSAAWNNGLELAHSQYGGMTWNFRPNSEHQMWVLESTDGATFDEVTEEMTGQTIAGVLLTQRDMYSSSENLLVVDPDYRNQRWGYRMLRYALDNHHDQLWLDVDTGHPEAMRFAAKYGRFEDSHQVGGRLVANVRFSYQNRNWLHAGCRCSTCLEEITSLTRSLGQVR